MNPKMEETLISTQNTNKIRNKTIKEHERRMQYWDFKKEESAASSSKN